METQLIKLDKGNVIVSDEPIKEDDLFIDLETLEILTCQGFAGGRLIPNAPVSGNWAYPNPQLVKKVVASDIHAELPDIDYTALTGKIQIGDEIFHPCSVDIIKHKVISIRQFEDFTHYVLKAVSNVGACGRIEVIVDEHKGKLRFVELVDEENVPHASGLQDFVEGNYYTTVEQAKVEFYEKQRTIAWSSMEKAERAYKKAKEHYNQIELLIKTFKQ